MPDASYFLSYQERWINDDAELKIAEKSRRVGFTYASSYRMFSKCMKRGRGFTQWVSSRDMFTAQELIRDYVSKWCALANVAAQGMYGDNVQVFDTEHDIKAYVCEFPNGSRIVSLASTPEVFAGKGGDVFLDEVDLHKDSGKLVDMAMPCITWGNQLEMVSAYRVDGSNSTPFALMVKEAKAANAQGASLHRVTIHDAIAQGIVEKIVEATGKPQTREEFLAKLRRRCRTLSAWQSQYECLVQEAGKLIPFDQIVACEMKAEDLQAILATNVGAPRFGGYDVARRIHASTWHEYALIGVTLFLARRERWHDVPLDEQEKWIETRLRDAGQPQITRMAIDSTGLGMQMAERLATKTFPGRVDAVNLESHRRHEICMLLADRFQQRRIMLPADEQLRADINGPRKALALNGAMRVVVPAFESEGGEISHSDEFISAVLANSAADAGAGSAFTPRAFRTPRYSAIRERRERRLSS